MPAQGTTRIVPTGRPGARQVICLLALLGVVACGAEPESREARSAGFGRRPLVQPSRTLSLERSETLAELLTRGGLSGPEVRRLLDRVRPHADWTMLDHGVEARFHRWPGEPPERIELRVDEDRTLDFTLRGAVWDLAIDSVAVTIDTVVVSGLLDGGLYSAALGGDEDALTIEEKAALAKQLAEVYAWQIDFYRDPKPGDAFRLAMVRSLRPDGSLRASTVLAAEYARGGHLLQAFRFAPSDEAGSYYYDADGSALRGAFLKAPLDLVRVTSRFSGSRYHPVLRSYRSHAGLDYGAPSGTPVRATGDGTVVRAGWSGDFGLLIELDHGRGIRTRYAHLSGIADALHGGATVRQGSVIGSVGSTGLSTASHLHYEFRLNGRAVDPSSVDLPVERPIPEADALRFIEARGAARSVLGRVLWPGLIPGSVRQTADSPDIEP